MGLTEKEKILRQVNVKSPQLSAVSEHLNTTSTLLSRPEEVAPGTLVSSPVMKVINEFTVDVPADAPSEQEVLDAHNEVGLTLAANSKKHPKRVARAAEKREMQRKLHAEYEAERRRVQDENADERNRLATLSDDEIKQYRKQKQESAFDKFQDMDLKSLMVGKSGSTIYEKLADNYAVIKLVLKQIPDYEKEVNERLAALGGSAIPEELRLAAVKLKTLYDIRAYYEVYERLMFNKYFAMLPRKEMHALSYQDLRQRLKKLYEAPNRNDELIEYYQNLIRLKEIGLEDKESVDARQQEYLEEYNEPAVKEDTRDPKEELKKMASAYADMTAFFKKDDILHSANERKRYIAKYFELCKKDIDAFRSKVTSPKGDLKKLLDDYDDYMANQVQAGLPEDSLYRTLKEVLPKDQSRVEKAGADPSNITLTDAQKEGVRQIGAWIMRHSFTDVRKHQSFAFNLLQTTPEQQILIYYLVENDKLTSPSAIDFHTAINNYQPDLESFKKNAGWDNISRAMRISMALNDQIKSYGTLLNSVKEADGLVADDRSDNPSVQRTDEEKRKNIARAIVARGRLLVMLYRNAGLHEDMPPDMVEDPVLRRQLYREFSEITSLVRSLNGAQVSADYNPSDLQTGLGDAEPAEESGTLDTVSGHLDLANEIVFKDVAAGGLGVLDSLGGAAVSVTDTAAYSHISGWLGGLAGLAGFVTASLTAAGIARDATISGADRLAQSLSVSGDFFEYTGGLLSSAGTLVDVFTGNIGTATSAWLGDSSEAFSLASKSTGELLAFSGGAVATIAGAAKFASSSVQLARSISSKNDVERSQSTLKERQDANGTLSKDEEKLKRFLDHENREATRNEISAGVGMVSGTLAMVSGVMLMSGFLAPIAGVLGLVSLGIDIFYGKIINTAMRHSNRKKAVDDMLHIDTLVDKVLTEHPEKERLQKMKRDDLKKLVREEAVSMMGFSSYKECYRHICTEYATLLYNKVFVENLTDEKEKNMYLDAMKSLGLKIRKPTVQGDEPKPSIEAMVTKMMTG